jgi:hypothetical protein
MGVIGTIADMRSRLPALVLISCLLVAQPADAVSLDSNTTACLVKSVGKAATTKIQKAKKLSAAQQRAISKCQSGAASTTNTTVATTSRTEPWYFSMNWDYTTALPRDPKCADNYPLKLSPAPIDTTVSLNRLGYSQPGAHAMPVPHHNISTRDLRGTNSKDEGGYLLVSERVNPIVSPADLTVIAMARNVYGRNVTTKEVYEYEEWMIAMHVCGTKYIVFNHIDDVPASWVAATKASGVREECNQGQDNARVCMYSYMNFPVKQGARIGRASGRSAGWDIGAWDTAKPTAGVFDPGKNTGRWATGTCVWEWFTPEIKSQWFQKFIGDKTSCGTHGHDVLNTLSGVWLAVGQRARAASEDLHIALFPSYKNDGAYRFSIGYSSNIPSLGGGIYEFTGESSGLRNPKFASVAPGQVACFDSFNSDYTRSTTVTRIFASMSAGSIEKIQIAGDSSGSCGQGPYSMPAGAVTFERRTNTTG